VESAVKRYLEPSMPAISETTETPETELMPEFDYVSSVSLDSPDSGMHE